MQIKQAHIPPQYCLLVTAAFVMLFLFCINTAQAASQAFRGITTSIIPDKACEKQPENAEITLVFDGDPKTASAGWIYGKETMAAELKKVTPTRFEVTYSITRYKKLPPSIMELTSTKNGFRAVVRDHIPEEKELKEFICFFEKLEVDLKPIADVKDKLKIKGKELFLADLLMQEGSDLVWVQKEYKSAIELGKKILPLYERNHGKWSLESRNAMAIIVFSLMGMERFDEALALITPYRKALPDHALLKEVETKILELKKKQDDLFRSDPDSKSEIDLGPLG